MNEYCKRPLEITDIYIYVYVYEKLLLPTQSPKKPTHTHAHYPRPPSLIHATRRLFHWFKKRTSFLTLVWSTCIQTDRNLKSRVTGQILFLHSTTYTGIFTHLFCMRFYTYSSSTTSSSFIQSSPVSVYHGSHSPLIKHHHETAIKCAPPQTLNTSDKPLFITGCLHFTELLHVK
jgi:hypothetical protein